MKILLVDDENLARQRLQRLLQDQANYEVIGEAANGAQALAQCEHLQPDTVLMDIRMPGMDGLEAARELAQWPVPPAVIFCSAYDDHALEAFSVHAVDYLLKPVRQERLLEALQRATRGNRAQLQQWAAPDTTQNRKIPVKVGNETHLIAISEILFFAADQKYVRLKTAQSEYLLEQSLKDLEQQLGPTFLRIHRNALVAVDQIAGLQRHDDGTCLLKIHHCSETLEISRRQLPHVRRLLKTL